MVDTMQDFKKQHMENYRRAILENIKNNTNVLVEDDIQSLLKKPPLDSMDILKTKFLSLAKKNDVILNTQILDELLSNYRDDIIKVCEDLKKIRIEELSSKVNAFTFEKDTDTIKLSKKDFVEVNKKMKKVLKEKIQDSISKKIVNSVNKLFTEDTSSSKIEKVSNEMIKFVQVSYPKQLLENVDFKVIVKDTTLINGVKGQAERYLFTLSNSRIFNQEEDFFNEKNQV